MKKILLALIFGIWLISSNMYAADGDLIVNGKIGVGTTSPSALLHLVDNGTTGFFYNDRIFSDVGGPAIYFRKSRGTTSTPAAVQAGDQLGRILFSGYDGTAWSVPSASIRPYATEKWTPTANGSSLRFATTNSGTTGQVTRMSIESDGGVYISNTGTATYKLSVDGAIYGTSYSGSDVRMKNNIKPIQNALALVQDLQGVSFNWKTEEYKDKNLDKGKQIGLVAQDVEKVLPELVKTDTEGYKAIAYEKLTAVLVEALKEQQKEIQTLKAEVRKLKNKNQN
jgi:hypothetical protein